VEMMVSAFDRSTVPDKPKKTAEVASATAPDEAKP